MSTYLTVDQVRAMLAEGHELLYYRENRHQFGGWAINTYCVHGKTVNGLLNRNEVREIPLTKQQRFIYTRRAVKS